MTSSQTLTPAAQISLTNDIFGLQLSGSHPVRTSGSGESRSSESWDSSLSSNWNIPLIPSLRFNYGEQTSSDTTAKNTNTGATLSWDLSLAQLNYQYTKSQTEDPDNDSLSASDSHFVRFETDGNFWDRRLAFDFAQQFQTSTQQISQGSTVVLDGQARGKLDTALPTDIDYVDPELDPGSIDLGAGNTLPVGTGTAVHISFKKVNSSILRGEITALRIYLDADPGLLPQWDLYARDTVFPPDSWTKVGENIFSPGSRDKDDVFFIEVPVPVGFDKDEILLVANFALPVTIRKFEAVTFLTEDFSGDNTAYLTNVGLRFRPTRTVNASVSMNLEHQQASDAQNDVTNDHLLVSGNLRWAPLPYLSPSLGYSENQDKQSGDPLQISRSYSLTVFTLPLKTMSVVFGATRTERFDGELKAASIDRFSISSKAQIYPDLSADLAFSKGYSDTWDWDHDGILTQNESFSSRLNLNAKLTRSLVADFTTSYGVNETVVVNPGSSASSEPETSESARGILGLQYRPSDLLALSGSYTTFLLGPPRSDEMSIGMTMGLVRTQKTRLTLVANRSQADTESTSALLLGSWDISRSLSMLSQASYSFGQNYVYSFMASLTLRL